MAIKSAAEFFRLAHGKRVRKTVTGVLTLEEWDDYVSAKRDQLNKEGKLEGVDFWFDDKGLNYKDGRFLLKPKLRAMQEGTLTVRSADYGFLPDEGKDNIWGDKKGAKVEGDKLLKQYPTGMTVSFELL